MRVGRTSIGNRILSMVLVLCMVIGMVPSTVFAAQTNSTADSVEAVRDFAANLLNNNVDWTAESNPNSAWKYYNGVMLTALLALGVDGNQTDALQYVKDWMSGYSYDTSDKTINGTSTYKENEVDSVPPALSLFTLLETETKGSANYTRYESMIHYVYEQLVAQRKYTDCGGMFLHKQDDSKEPADGWTTWNIGLDGVYMALPFLMEYANAVASGKISNTESVKAADIYKQVYDIIMWVSEAMYDETTGLYHHGYSVNGDSENGGIHVNGQFWGRGIGWYAAGLVMCIDAMPAGAYKEGMIAKLPKLFDGMLRYQDKTTGMWYNVVNEDATLTAYNGNQLETSVSGLMSYALMKAYNEGWVEDSKYAEAAVAALNGIVSEKMNSAKTVIKDVYVKSGVGTEASYYCKENYTDETQNEAKGIGGVLLAAAEVAQYLEGTAEETFTAGVVNAPSAITIPTNATSADIAKILADQGVKITLLGSHGTVRQATAADGITYSFNPVSTTAADSDSSTQTVYVIKDNDLIDTLSVTAVDTAANTATGDLVIGGTAEKPAAGTTSVTNSVVVPGSTNGGGNTYTHNVSTDEEATAAGDGVFYVFKGSECTDYGQYSLPDGVTTNKSWKMNTSATVTFKPTKNGKLTFSIASTSAKAVLVINNDSYKVTAKNTLTTETVNLVADTEYKLSRSGSNFGLYYLSFVEEGGSTPNTTYEITLSTTDEAMVLAKGATKELAASLSAKVTPEGGTETTATSVTLKEGNAISWTSDNEAAVTVDANGKITAVAAGEAIISATVAKDAVLVVDGTEVTLNLEDDLVVTIPVAVADSTTYEIQLTVEPGAIVAEVGDEAVTLTHKVTVDGVEDETAVVTYSCTNNGAAIVTDGGVVTITAKGEDTVTVTVTEVTAGGQAYTLTDPVSTTVLVSVTEPVVEEHTHNYVASETKAPTCTETGTMTYTCSCGESYTEEIKALGHSYGTDGKCTVCGETDPDYSEPTEETTEETTEEPTSEPTTAPTQESTEPVQPTEFAKVKISTGSSDIFETATSVEGGKVYTISRSGNVNDGLLKTSDYSWTENEDGTYTLENMDQVYLWTLTAADDGFYISNGTVYLSVSSSKQHVQTVPGIGDATTFIISPSDTSGKFTIVSNESDSKNNTGVQIQSSGAANLKSSPNAEFFRVQKVNTTTSYYAISPLTVACEVGDDISQSILDQIVLWSATNTSGEGAAQVTENKPTMTLSGLDTTTAGSQTVQVLVNGTEIGTVTVNVNAVDCDHTSTTEIPAVAPTCTEKGLTAGEKCADCGTIITAQAEIPALGHNYSSAVTTQPGCTTVGVMTYTCATCGNSYTEDIAATGHTYVNGACTVCNALDPDYPAFESITTGNVSVLDDTAKVEKGKELLLTANVNNLTDSYTLSWAVADGTGSATLVDNGDKTATLTGVTVGTVTVTVTIAPVATTLALDADTGVVTETFTVTVTEPSVLPTVPTVSESTTYNLVTGITEDISFFVMASGNNNATHGTDPGAETGTWTKQDDGTYTCAVVPDLWVFEKIANSDYYYIYYINDGNAYYLNGNGSNYAVCSTTKDTKWSVSVSTNGNVNIVAAEGTAGDDRVDLKVDSDKGPKFEGSAQTMHLYTPVISDDVKVGTVETLIPGQTAQLAITVIAGGVEIDNATVVCTSDGSSTVATVTEAGLITAVAAGTTNINVNVTLPDGTEMPTETVSVKVAVPTVAITGADKVIINGTSDYTAGVNLEGVAVDSFEVEWSVAPETATDENATSLVVNQDGSATLTGIHTTKVDILTAKVTKVNGVDVTALDIQAEKTVSCVDKWVTGIQLVQDSVSVSMGGTVVWPQLSLSYSDGFSENIDLTDARITLTPASVDTSEPGVIEVTVTYQDEDFEGNDTLTVTVKDPTAQTHDFTHDNPSAPRVDPEGFFEFTGDIKTNKSVTYNGQTLTTSLYMDSDGSVSFKAEGSGTLTMVFSGGNTLEVTKPDKTTEIVTIPSSGIVEIPLKTEGEYTIQKKSTSGYLFYVEVTSDLKDGVTISEAPGLYIGQTSATPTYDLNEVVRHAGEAVTKGYTLEWTSSNPEVASVDANGMVTGQKPGTVTITATVTMDDETVYTATTTVNVYGPYVTATEDLDLVLQTATAEATIDKSVVIAGVAGTNVVWGFHSSDKAVATVDENGKVTAEGVGSAVITTYVKSINGVEIDTDAMLYSAATTVTVSERQITSAYLNSYDYVIAELEEGETEEAWMAKLEALLQYKESIHGPEDDGSIDGEEGIKLTIEYNDGSNDIAKYGETNTGVLSVDLTGVNPDAIGINYVTVTYTVGEGEDAAVIFKDTIWVHVMSKTDIEGDGTMMMMETDVTYHLDTDGKLDVNKEYIIVSGDSTAISNLVSSDASAQAGSVTVTKSEDKLTLEISEANAAYARWLLDTEATVNGNQQFHASNLNCYLGQGSSERLLVHTAVKSLEFVCEDAEAGAYNIIVYRDGSTPYYLALVSGRWVVSSDPHTLYLYRRDAVSIDVGFDYELWKRTNEEELPIDETTGHYHFDMPLAATYNAINPMITFRSTETMTVDSYVIQWTSSDPSVATVDQNGVVRALKVGTTTITATLYDINNMKVICNTHDTNHVTRQVEITVADVEPEVTLDPKTITIGVGSMPDFTKVNVKLNYPGTAYDWANVYADWDDISFSIIDAVGEADNESDIGADVNLTEDGKIAGFYNMIPGVYTVPVVYNGLTRYLTVNVDPNPYAGLDPATRIPGYPEAGAVRIDKTATGVIDFNSTGVSKLQLDAAGISTKSSVDVVLVVDVSNSMGWSMEWFKTDPDSKSDSVKVAKEGQDTKLDMAMDAADAFAKILLGVQGGDNTVSFVTFAGFDPEHTDSDTGHQDSVRIPMLGVTSYTQASAVFQNTYFTEKNNTSYPLHIGGIASAYSDGETETVLNNRGNTNYDYAFGQATEAVRRLKEKYAAENNGASYDDSDRQIHVVFMTDGAPSHYNDERVQGEKHKDLLWGSSSNTYGDYYTSSADTWLTWIENYHTRATALFDQVTGFYNIGFDLAHGGFDTWSWTEVQMERVLAGLVKNQIIPTTLATDQAALNEFYTSLATKLAYAGTEAKVSDTVGEAFSLFTGMDMYSAHITEAVGENKIPMSTDVWAEMKELQDSLGGSFPITVYSHRLVLESDIGSTLDVINLKGDVETIESITEEHLGLRVSGSAQEVEKVTFERDENGALSAAYSTGKTGNILTIDGDTLTIKAEYFTYTATLDTMTVDGKTVSHTKDEQIIWQIGNVTDKEFSMEYYVYLDGSLDNPRVADSGTYQTNEIAYIEYIDANGDYVYREYGVPKMAWGKANVTVRFFLVNEKGEYVNRAGTPFTNPANRIFLTERAQYTGEWNNTITLTTQAALVEAGLASYTLYDPNVTVAVENNNSATYVTDGVDWTFQAEKDRSQALHTFVDNSNGFYSSVVLDVPVIMTDIGNAERPLSNKTVVMDYGKPMDINVFNTEEQGYASGYRGERDGVTYLYKMELAGFARYSANFDLRNYVPETGYAETLTTDNGSYSLVDGKVRFTPSTILQKTEHVFVAVKFIEIDWETDELTDQYYYMYKQLNIIPANVMYYETDGNMDGSFEEAGTGGCWSLNNANVQSDVQSDYTAGSDIYGYDASYDDDPQLSNGSAWIAAGTGVNTTTTTFTFTGTGFDIISRTGPEDGTIRVQVLDANGNKVKTVSVINKGENTLYQIPVVSIEGLEYGQYTVVIGVFQAVTYSTDPESSLYKLNRGNTFVFDAVRIYGTLLGTETFQTAHMEGEEYVPTTETVNSYYAADGEAGNAFVEIRDQLISAESFHSNGSAGAMFLDDFTPKQKTDENGDPEVDEEGNPVMEELTPDTYRTSGANNEVYLATNNAVAFSFTFGTEQQSFDLGMKSVDGKEVVANVTIVDGSNGLHEKAIEITSSTAQFFDLVQQTGYTPESDETIHVVISNTGAGILSLTDLKINGANTLQVTPATVLAAQKATDPGLDVTSVRFKADTVQIAGSVEMTVTTEANVTKLLITNGYGDEVWAVATKNQLEKGGEITWTVKVRPTLLGDQTYTVYGFRTVTAEDGTVTNEYGESGRDTITVTLY